VIWALAELFPGLVAARLDKKPAKPREHVGAGSWMN
jgi:hypothetical protein